MDEEQKALIRQWKQGMEEVNRVTRDENRRRTPEERLAIVLALMDEYRPGNGSSNEITDSRRRWRRAVERLRVEA